MANSWKRAWIVPLLLAACSGRPAERPNVVLIVLDTVRADRLSCYGYERPTTPRIDALCERGIRFTNASATSAWTLPSHASLFTGLYPLEHGATQESARLARGLPTLAEILGSYGYETLGVSANPLVGRATGLERGFARFVDAWRPAPEAGDHPVLAGAKRLLADSNPERPFFLFLNFMEAHSPYLPREPERSRFLRRSDEQRVASALELTEAEFYVDPGPAREAVEVWSDLYDAEIATLDGIVGALLDALEAGGHLENTLLVLTSDHGESFGEHDHVRHVFQLYGSVVRIPLLLVPPSGERAGEARSDPVSLVDVFSTILERAGAAASGDRYPGRDLLADPAALEATPVFAEYYYPLQALANLPASALEAHGDVFAPFRRRLRSVEADGLRLIASSGGEDELFDLVRDPGERADLSADPSRAEDLERLRSLLSDFVEAGGGPPPLPDTASLGPRGPRAFGELDPETAERLRELGYLRP